MPSSGTVTIQTRSPELLEATWAVSSPTNNMYSDPIDVKDYGMVEYYLASNAGYTSGTATIGLMADAAQVTLGDGLIAEDVGRHIRAERTSTSLNQSGYLMHPPSQIVVSVGNHDGTATEYTVKIIARPIHNRRVGAKR